MAKNKSFTGGRRSNGTPTLRKEQMFQLIKKAREANERVSRRTPDCRTPVADVPEGLADHFGDRTI